MNNKMTLSALALITLVSFGCKSTEIRTEASVNRGDIEVFDDLEDVHLVIKVPPGDSVRVIASRAGQLQVDTKINGSTIILREEIPSSIKIHACPNPNAPEGHVHVLHELKISTDRERIQYITANEEIAVPFRSHGTLVYLDDRFEWKN